MKKRLFVLFMLVLLVFSACESNKNTDFSGVYTDKQGTDEIYSELELSQKSDGTYDVSVGIYRLAALEGTAEYRDGVLCFVSDAPHVEGNITKKDGGAEIVITVSDFDEIQTGDVYQFPDGA